MTASQTVQHNLSIGEIMSNQAENSLSPRQQAMLATFQQHVYAEITGDLTTTMATMNASP